MALFCFGKIKSQDAYALCRVIKKSTVIVPKVGGQYVNVSHANQITRDQSSSIEHYSEGREEDLDSSNYFMSMDTFSLHNMGNDNSLNINSGTRDLGTLSHFSSEDPLFNLPTSFANYGAITYPPSQVHKNFHTFQFKKKNSMHKYLYIDQELRFISPMV